jgi:hypothetical protein
LTPAAALSVVKVLNVPLTTGESTTWTIAAVLWFTVSILATQPDFKDRIAATKDIANLMTTGGR